MQHYEAGLIRSDFPETFIEAAGSAAEVERLLTKWAGLQVSWVISALTYLSIAGILAVIGAFFVTNTFAVLAAAVVPCGLLAAVGVIQSKRVGTVDSGKRDMALALVRQIEKLAPGSQFDLRIDARRVSGMFAGPPLMFTRDHTEKQKLVWFAGSAVLPDGRRLSLMCQTTAERRSTRVTLPSQDPRRRDRESVVLAERGRDRVDLRCSPGPGQTIDANAPSDIAAAAQVLHHLELENCEMEDGGISTRFTGLPFRRKKEEFGWKVQDKGGRLDEDKLQRVAELTLGAVTG